MVSLDRRRGALPTFSLGPRLVHSNDAGVRDDPVTAAKIAFVHDWLTGMRGGEKCLDVLCRAFPQAEIHTLLHAPGSTAPSIEDRPIHTSYLQRLPGSHRHYRYLLPLMPSAVRGLRIPSDVDLVVSFSHAVAKSVPVPAGAAHLCYCFSPMRYAWQLRDDYFGSNQPAGVIAGRVTGTIARARNAVLDALCDWDKTTSAGVTRFVACSRTIAARIRACYGRESQVVYPPVDTDFYSPAAVPREDFYLCVSALVPYKRIDLAIEACERLGRRLIVIGQGPERRALARLAARQTTFLGWQSDETIRDHLRRCRALLFPGLEDFGIVPVEAQACGAAVIAYGQGGATETVIPTSTSAGGTGLFFAEQTVESLCQSIAQFERASDEFSPALARRNALRFGVDRYRGEMLAAIEGLLATSR